MPAHLIAEDGPFRGLVLNLEEGSEWIVGRDSDAADFYLEDSTVSRKHARLNKTEDGIYLKNLSRVNPVLLNEAELEHPTKLKEGDRIQIGSSTFLFSEEEIPEMGEAPKKKGGYDDIFGGLDEPAEEIDPEVPAEEIEAELPPTPPKPERTAYDTIFEETGPEQEAPYQLAPEEPLLLKVISGPNAGAEIGIEKGKSYTIGKDSATNDIVFQDLSVSRNHAKLSVSDDGTIQIEDLGSKNGVAVNGSAVVGPTIITSQDLVALGTTVFLILDREAPQETIYSPLSQYEAPKLVEVPAQEEAPVQVARDWKKEPIPSKYLILGGSVAAIFLIMFVSFFSLFKSDSMEIAVKHPDARLKDALEKFHDVQFSYNPASGKLFLVGHVLTPIEYQEMKYRLGELDFVASVEDNVVIDEGVWRAMNDVLSTNSAWRGVSVHSPKAGKFVASGYVPTIAEGTAVSEYFTVNFPYLDLLENQVVIEENLNTQLQSVIATHNLGGVLFQLAGGNVILSGKYSEKMESEYKELMKEINTLKGVASVKSFAIAVPADQAGIDISGQYQVSGTAVHDGKGYSVVMNGKIFRIGDLVDGMKITLINSGAVVLEKDGLKYRIDYTL